MTDEDSPDTDSRRKRLATRRRRIRAAAVVVIIALVAVGIGGAMALRSHDKSSAATPRHSPRSNTSASAPDPTLGVARTLGPPRMITHADPMKLWIGGDSLAGSFGPALGQTAGATGVVDATVDYKVSSGLEDLGIRDWYEHAQEEMAGSDPDAIVFIIGTNDASIVNSEDSNHDGVPDWQVDYAQKIDRMMKTFVGGSRHRTVFWLGPPTLGDHTLNKGGYALGRLMRVEAAKFAPDVVYVDTYHLFADKDGKYSRDLPDAHGNSQEMRISDGVHFTVDGAQYLANAIWKLLDKRWDVTAQADPSQPIDYTIAPGGEEVPGVGYYRPTVPSSSDDNNTTSSSPSSETSTSTDSSSTTSVTTTTKPSTSSTTGSGPTTTVGGSPTTTKSTTPPTKPKPKSKVTQTIP